MCILEQWRQMEETFGCVPERIFKILTPYADTGFTVKILTTASEDG